MLRFLGSPGSKDPVGPTLQTSNPVDANSFWFFAWYFKVRTLMTLSPDHCVEVGRALVTLPRITGGTNLKNTDFERKGTSKISPGSLRHSMKSTSGSDTDQCASLGAISNFQLPHAYHLRRNGGLDKFFFRAPGGRPRFMCVMRGTIFSKEDDFNLCPLSLGSWQKQVGFFNLLLQLGRNLLLLVDLIKFNSLAWFGRLMEQ